MKTVPFIKEILVMEVKDQAHDRNMPLPLIFGKAINSRKDIRSQFLFRDAGPKSDDKRVLDS